MAAGLVNLGVLHNDFAYDDVRVAEALRRHAVTVFDRPAQTARQTPDADVPTMRDQGTRPLTYATFLLDHRIWGDAPRGFHLTNLLLHMLAAGLVYAAALALARSRPAALWGALAFAVHPIHVEAVASFVNRKDILALVFALASLLAWIRIRPAAPRLLATAALLALGFAAKEVAVAGLPLVLLAAHDFERRQSASGPSPWAAWTFRFLAGAVVLVVVAGLLAGERLPFFDTAHIREATEQQLARYDAVLANVALGFLRLARLLLVPLGLSADYPVAARASLAGPAVLIGLGVLAALVALPLVLHRRHPGAALAVAWLIALDLPISNLVPLVHYFAADRYAYVPSFGACVLAGMAVARLEQRVSGLALARSIVVGAATLVLAWFAFLTVRRVPEWKDDLALWSSASRAGFGTYRVHQKLGVALIRAGDANADAAARELSLAVALRPDRVESHRWLAGALFAGDRADDALREASAVLGVEPGDPVCRFIRGEVRFQRGDAAGALADYRAAVAADSSHVGALIRVAMLDLALAGGPPGAVEEALALARRAAELTAGGDAAAHEQAIELVRRAGAAVLDPGTSQVGRSRVR